jgi:hypothetical protein
VDIGDADARFDQLFEFFKTADLIAFAGDDRIQIELASLTAGFRRSGPDARIFRLGRMMMVMIVAAAGAVDVTVVVIMIVLVVMLVMMFMVVAAFGTMHVVMFVCAFRAMHMTRLVAMLAFRTMRVLVAVIVLAFGAVVMLVFVIVPAAGVMHMLMFVSVRMRAFRAVLRKRLGCSVLSFFLIRFVVSHTIPQRCGQAVSATILLNVSSCGV